MDRRINILNWNINGIKSRKYELMNVLQENQIEVAAITETRTRPGEKFYLKNYKIYREDRKDKRGGGVMLLVKDDICSTKIEYKSLGGQVEATGALIEHNNQKIEFVSMYVPSGNIKKEFLGNIGENNKVLIIGDLNAKHPVWGSRIKNERGKQLLRIANEENFIVESPEDATSNPGNIRLRGDVIDIFLRRQVSIEKPKVLFEFVSDHYPVITSIKGRCTRKTTKPVNKTNWCKFKKLMEGETKGYGDDIEDRVARLTGKILAAIDIATKTIHTSATYINKHNLTESEKKVIKKKNKCKNRYKKYRLPEDKYELMRLQAEVHEIIKNAKQRRWNNTLQECENSTNGDMWKILKRIRRRKEPNAPLKDKNNTLKFKDEEKCEILAEHMEKQFTNQMKEYTAKKNRGETKTVRIMKYNKKLTDRKSVV